MRSTSASRGRTRTGLVLSNDDAYDYSAAISQMLSPMTLRLTTPCGHSFVEIRPNPPRKSAQIPSPRRDRRKREPEHLLPDYPNQTNDQRPERGDDEQRGLDRAGH